VSRLLTLSEARAVLGLTTTFSDAELRTAYHRKAKELHPDLATDEPAAHLNMIGVNQAYNLLRTTVGRQVPDPQAANRRQDDYKPYRSGVGVFERIHPSEWVKVSRNGLFDPNALEQKVERSVAYRMAIKRIGEAYQLFSELVNGFPESMWANDSRDKLKQLDKMLDRYRKMSNNAT
jgi:curved DNA-binding protein CbpA